MNDALTLLLQIIENSPEGSELPTLESLEPNQSLLTFDPATSKWYLVKKEKIIFPGEPVTSILGLTDTPGSFNGQKGKVWIVNDEETGLVGKLLAELEGVSEQQLNDAVADLEAQIAAIDGGGSSPTTTPTTYIESFDVLYLNDGWKYRVVTYFVINGVAYSDTREHILPAADATYDRISAFVLNIDTRQSEVINGDPAENPLHPNIDLTLYLDPDRFIIVPANAQAPVNINSVSIYAENLGTAGGEWNIPGTVGPDFDLANTENPKSGAVAIKATDLQNSQLIRFIAEAPLPVAQAKRFAYDIRNIVGGAHSIMILGTRSNGRSTSETLPSPANFGYVAGNTASYQSIVIPYTPSQIVNITEVRVISNFTGLSYYLDNVRFESGEGVSEPIPGNYADTRLSNIETLTETEANIVKQKLGITDAVGASEQFVIDGDDATLLAAQQHSDANRADLELQIDEVEEDVILLAGDLANKVDKVTGKGLSTEDFTPLEKTKLGKLDLAPIAVSTSRLLAATDHNRTLLITATVTLTYPAGGIAGLKVNFDCGSAGLLTIADQNSGNDLNAVSGKILEAEKMGHAYVRPDNSKLRLKGDWKE